MAQRRKKKLTTDQTGQIFKLVSWEACTSEYRQAYVIGWQSIMDNADWHPAYDELPKMMQEGYENGRLDCINVKASGIPVPFWGRISQQPPECRQAIQEAYWYWHKKGVPQTARPKHTIVNKYGDVIGME